MKTSDFEFIKLLASGSFGSIHLVRQKSDSKKFVIKRQDEYYYLAVNERLIMKKLRHPNIPAYYESWEEGDGSKQNEENEEDNENEVNQGSEEYKENEEVGEDKNKEYNLENKVYEENVNEETVKSKENQLDVNEEIGENEEIQEYEEYYKSSCNYYILMEYLSGGTLYDLLNEAYATGYTAMTENEALNFFSQLLLGLDHLHSHQIIHRDLKPENVMFTDLSKKVKIIDFGLSRDVSVDMDIPMVNPNDYTAPENFSEQVPYTFKSDIWSIATLLYEVVTGYQPKHLEDKLEVLEDLPPSVRTICKYMLKVEPNERPESHEVIRYSELKIAMHKYYRSLDTEEREIVKLQLHGVIDYDDI